MTSALLRMALYNRDAKGLGHLRRSLTSAHHLTRALPGLAGRDITGLVITGLAPGQEYRLPDDLDWLVLPGVEKSGGIYQPQRLRITHKDLGKVRSTLLSGVLSTFTPGLLVIDRHVYGVHQGLHEPLTHLRHTRPSARVVFSLREVLDTPTIVQHEWDGLDEADMLYRLIGEIWVYGDAVVRDLNVTGEAPSVLEERMHYTDYLAHDRDITEPRDDSEASSALVGNALDPEPFILTTAGGGYDGIHLLHAATQVRVPDDYRYVVVIDPQPDIALSYQVIRTAGLRAAVRRSWSDMNYYIQQVTVVVMMTGYSTATGILASEISIPLIPCETSRLERFIRTSGLEKADAIDLLRVTDLNVAVLEGRLSELLGGQKTSHRQLIGQRHLRLDDLAVVPLLTAEFTDHRHGASTTSPTYLISHTTSLVRMRVPT